MLVISTKIKILFWNYFAQFERIVLGFFFIRILSRGLGSEQYGAWAQVLASILLVTSICAFNLGHGFIRFSSHKSDEEKSIYFWSVLLFQTLIVVILLLLFIPLGSKISYLLLNRYDLFYIIAIVLISGLMLFQTQIGNLLIVHKNTILFGKLRAIERLLFVGIVLCFYFYFETIKSIVLGAIIANIIITVCFFFIARNKLLKPKFKPKKVYEMLSFSIPLIPVAFSYWVLNSSSKYIIKIIMGLEYVGKYSVAYALPAMIVMTFTVLSSIFFSYLVRNYENKEFDKVNNWISIILRIYLSISISLTFIFFIYSKQILLFMSDSSFLFIYYDYVFLFIGLGSVLFGCFQIISRLYDLEKKVWKLSRNWIIAMLANIILSILFTYKFGLIGCALALVIAYSIGLLSAIWFFQSKKLSINFNVFNSFIFLFICIISSFIIKSYLDNNIISYILAIPIFIYFLFISYILNILRKNDIIAIYSRQR